MNEFGGVPACLVSRRIAVLHLKPDCLGRGLSGDAVRLLGEHGFRVAAFRVGAPTRDLLWLMHGRSLDWTVDDWFHNIRLYEFGPALTLLLHSDGDAGATSAQQRLSAIKGGALPSLFGRGTLRRMLGARTRIFNLVHCADHIEEALAEALCCFDPSVIASAADAADGLEAREITSEIAAHAYGGGLECELGALWTAWQHRIRHSCRHSPAAEAVAAESLVARLGAPDAGILDLKALLMLMERLHVYSSPVERYVFESHFLYGSAASASLPRGERT